MRVSLGLHLDDAINNRLTDVQLTRIGQNVSTHGFITSK